MSDNYVKNVFENWISEGLGVSIALQGLKLDTAQDVADLLSKIKTCQNMKYLELEGNSLGVEAAKAIAKEIECKPEFEAALWKDLFTGRLKSEIPEAFKYLFAGIDLSGARLQRLDLSDNAIGPVGMVGLGPFFQSPSSFSLKELILNNNGFGPEGGSLLATALLNCYRKSLEVGEPFGLKIFVCGRNRLENKAAIKFAEFFEEIKTLEEIHMPQNGIYTPGITALSKALKNNENLRVVNLNDNTVRPDGSEILAESLMCLNNLEEVNLGDCLLKSKGARCIANSLRERKSIKKINMESNEIGRAAGIDVANVLRTFTNLTNVNLSSNEFGDEAVEDILKLLNSVEEVLIEDDIGEADDENENDEEDEEEYDDENYEDYDEEDEEAYDGDVVYEGEQIKYGGEVEEGEYEENLGNYVYNPLNTSGIEFSFSSALDALSLKKPDDDTTVFFQRPSSETFFVLKPDSYQKIKDHIQKSYNEERTLLDLTLEGAVKVAGLQETLDKNVENYNCFKDLMKDAVKTNNELFCSYLLSHLGLIKNEDKKKRNQKIPNEVFETLSMYIAEEEDCFPNEILNSLNTFFEVQRSNNENFGRSQEILFGAVQSKM